MLDTLPDVLHHKIVDCFGSPKSRQSWAQVNHEARRRTQESDSAYYEKWLHDDFARDAPVGEQLSAKDAYRAHLEVSRHETARLMHLAEDHAITRFASGIADAGTLELLSSRYGKRPVARAGLHLTQRLAQPRGRYESPPRLREGELAALHNATRALHRLADIRGEEMQEVSFDSRLHEATEQAAQRITRATCPGAGPPAIRRKLPSKLYGAQTSAGE